MNYYERHLGDYSKDTAHLSMLEHGAYGLLLDRYYSTESGIPADQAHRVARARTREEKMAVDAVLGEFFQLIEGVWINNRAEEEIAKYKEKAPQAEIKKENAAERQRRSRERRAKLFAEAQSHGISLPFNASITEIQRALSRVTSSDSHSDVTHPVTRENTALQSPVTRHHTPDIKPTSPSSSSVGASVTALPAQKPDDDDPQVATERGKICSALRPQGVKVVPHNPEVQAWIDDGITLSQLLHAVDKAREYKPKPEPIGVRYLDTTVRNMLAESAKEKPAASKRLAAFVPALDGFADKNYGPGGLL